MIRRAMRARELPPAAISASCVGRTLMIANSAATKNPFAMMNSKARSKYQPGMLTEREGPSRYEMEGRPWKRGIVSIVILSRRSDVAEGAVAEDGRRTPRVLASSKYRPPIPGYQEGGPSTVLRSP